MTAVLIQTGLSNTCFALVLAVVAMIAGYGSRRPQLAWLLWLLVFVKLVTPPVWQIPVAFSAGQSALAAVPKLAGDLSNAGTLANAPGSFHEPQAMAASTWQTALSAGWTTAVPWLGLIWLSGTIVIIAWSLVRVWRFNRLLRQHSIPANDLVQRPALRISRQLGLRALPELLTTLARISPLVWWAGGRVQVVIPQSLLDGMDEDAWHLVLAHELAHVRRRDYLVRWLEWIACMFFWWNPVVWWAQRNLRACEELCCDALVLSRLNPVRHSYAESILKTVESLVCPAFRPPAMASEINSGGYLERRVVMIMSGNVMQKSSRLMQMCVLSLALLVFPLGLAFGQDYEKVEKRLQNSVEKGHLSQAQANAMMATLKRMGDRDSDRAPERVTDRNSGENAAKDVYRRAAAELEKALVEGKISKEDMEKRLSGLRASFAERLEMADERIRPTSVEDLRRAAVEMEKMVAEGRITAENAAQRLTTLRKILAETQKQEAEERQTITAQEFERAAAEMKKMVAEGKAKKEDVEQRLAEMRKVMAEKQESAGQERRTFTVQEFDRAAAEMKKMAAEGKAKKEDVEQRLAEMRKMMDSSGKKFAGKGDKAKVDAKVAQLREIEAKIRAAVESGDISREEAGKKLEAFRAEMFASDQAKKGKAADELNATSEGLARRLKIAVESGRITEEEAEARWKAFEAGIKQRENATRDGDSKKAVEAKKDQDDDGDGQ